MFFFLYILYCEFSQLSFSSYIYLSIVLDDVHMGRFSWKKIRSVHSAYTSSNKWVREEREKESICYWPMYFLPMTILNTIRSTLQKFVKVKVSACTRNNDFNYALYCIWIGGYWFKNRNIDSTTNISCNHQNLGTQNFLLTWYIVFARGQLFT